MYGVAFRTCAVRRRCRVGRMELIRRDRVGADICYRCERGDYGSIYCADQRRYGLDISSSFGVVEFDNKGRHDQRESRSIHCCFGIAFERDARARRIPAIHGQRQRDLQHCRDLVAILLYG